MFPICDPPNLKIFCYLYDSPTIDFQSTLNLLSPNMAKIAKIHSGGNLKLTGFGLKFRSEIIRAGFSACGGSRYNYIYICIHTYIYAYIQMDTHTNTLYIVCVISVIIWGCSKSWSLKTAFCRPFANLSRP